LADEEKLGVKQVAPIIVLRGSASGKQRVNQVTIYGADQRFWPGESSAARSHPSTPWIPVRLNATLARELGVGVRDRLTLHFQKVSTVPRETLLGHRKAADILDDLRVIVTEVLPDEDSGGFSLTPNLGVPRNVFVPLGDLQEHLGQKGHVNALLVAG